MNSRDQKVLEAILRTDFESFLRYCVGTLNPGQELQSNWHISAIAHVLERVRTGELTRVIINLPPRYLKSIMASVAFPAFVLGHDPRRPIITISYGNELSSKHASDFRSIVTSRRYVSAFPGMKLARVSDDEVTTIMRGFRKSTSIGGTLTGLGGDLFIIDDPQKPIDAQSATRRDSLNQWFSNTLLSRLDNKRTGAIIIVMQRVHLDDLSGYLISQSDEWYVLSLPAIAEINERVPLGYEQFYDRLAGEPLHPARETLEMLEAIRRDVGSDIFSAQYQQSPVPPGGAMIKRAWLRYYSDLPAKTGRTKIIQAWDTAAKEGTENDWSVCTTWFVTNKNFYLMDLTRGRYTYPRLKATAMALAQRFEPDVIMVEDAYTGTALGQELKQERLGLAVRLIPVTHDKISRLYVHQAKFEAGLVHLPKEAHFLPELEAELLSFPQCRNDDQVDSISLALTFKSTGYGMMDVV